jgi:hypothetical protein
MAYSTDGITWTGLGTTQFGTSAGATGCFGIICGSSRWVAVGGTGSGSPNNTIYYADNPTSTWTTATGPSGTGGLYSVTFGTYPLTSTTTGTGINYGTIFIAAGGSASACYYSITGGVSWIAVAILGSSSANGLTWNGKRFIAAIGGGSGIIQYSYNPTLIANWYTTGITPTAPQLFSTSINALASSAWPTLGSIYVNNALTLSSSSGLNTNNQLDIYSDTYFNNGYNNMAATIKATQIP